MAKQICFYLNENNDVREAEIDYEYFAGFAMCQKRKCIQSLHKSIKETLGLDALEISSRSEQTLGYNLSAFNLSADFRCKQIPVENLYQGSKIFQNGGPYQDLYEKTPLEAKRDPRIKNSGKVIGFKLFTTDLVVLFNIKKEDVPDTSFYNYIWLYGLACHKEYIQELIKFSAFTDTAFNPNKSLNCQARAAAIFVSCYRKGISLGITFDKYCALEKKHFK